MGANHSTVPIDEKLLAERLEVLKMEDDEYIHVDEKSRHFKAPWTSLSVGEVADWEHEFLADPKNRYILFPAGTSLKCGI